MATIVSDNEKRAREIFASPAGINTQEMLDVAARLRDEDNNIEYARRLLKLASEAVSGPGRNKILRDLAICTYKSPDQPLADRLDEAEKILKALLDDRGLDEKLRQDALGILGAVYKQRWTAVGRREHLEMSLSFYRQGMEFGIELDKGYNAINAAFVLDLLASAAVAAAAREAYREEARQIREQVRNTLLPWVDDKDRQKDFWFYTTLGEACLGLRRFSEAEGWMKEASERMPSPWQVESTARQNATLASLIAADRPEQERSSFDVVKALLKGNDDAARSFLLGKVGLALSGGGFRASLFHIGVLARLAELDVLRHVEVISCVSGGSIVGAYYYLELRKRLQSNTDSQLTRNDYIEIVQSMEKNFLEGVQKNIRLRMLMESNMNARVWLGQSMTERLAALYDRELYSRVKDEPKVTRRSISDIYIQPAGHEGKFSPKYANWTRRHKVPILVLNATTLNTCHNWQFTGSFMGEPPGRLADIQIDANNRLRRMYYAEAPPSYCDSEGRSRIKLSEAVAASACVPVLFDPLVLKDLYGTTFDPEKQEPYVTRLVDGGNYDNQGLASLLDQDCSVLLISDASGQTAVSFDPGGSRFDVLKRSNDILMARVRQAQFQLLSALESSNALRGVMYVHLKLGIEATSVDWIDSPDRPRRTTPGVLTGYGMRYDIQRLLAGIRTDLDSFSNCEADALMLSGYLMTRNRFIPDFPVCSDPGPNWRFFKIASIAANEKATADTVKLRKALEVGAELWGKPWRVSKPLQTIGGLCALVLLFSLIEQIRSAWRQPLPAANVSVGTTAMIAGGILVLSWLLKKLRWSPLGRLLVSFVLVFVGGILLRLHLWLVEPFYLRFGPRYR